MRISKYRVITLTSIQDARGSLTPLEFKERLGFLPKRVFTISCVSRGTIRGKHAHKECIQAIQCIQGRVKVHISDGRNVHEVVLETENSILILPVLNWATFKFLDSNSKLIVYANKEYDEKDYLRDYEEFLSLTKKMRAKDSHK